MDIPELSMAMAQTEVMNQVSIELMSKALDQMESTGNALVEQIGALPSGVMTAEHINVLI